MTQSSAAAILAFDTPDVLAMVRPEFYEPITYTDFMAFRHCAVVALLACSHIEGGTQAGIKFSHWRPEGKDVVVVKRWGKMQTIPLTPQVIFIVERFMAERERVRCLGGAPRWESEYLFVTQKGKTLKKSNIYHLFSLRMKGPKPKSVPGALMRFCARNIRNGSSSDVERRFRGFAKKLGSQVIELPDVPLKEMMRIVLETNPFKDLDREVRGPVAAQKYFAKHPPAVAMQQPGRKKLMPVKHPLVTLLLKVKWPKGKREQAELRAVLRLEHGLALDGLLRDRVLTGEHIGQLLRVKMGAALMYHKAHYGPQALERKVVTHKPKPKRVKAAATVEERAILQALRAQSWPRGEAEAAKLSQDLMLQHYAAVDALITRDLITVAVLAKLFRASPGRIVHLRAALRHGVSVAEVPIGRTQAPLPAEWWNRIRAEASVQGDESNIALYFRMVKEGFPGTIDTFKDFMATLQRRKTALSQEERLTIDTLSALARPEDPDEAAVQRERMLPVHFVDLNAIVVAKKISPADGRQLLDIDAYRFGYIAAALEAGLTIEQALKNDFTDVSAEMWSIVRAEHAASPAEPLRSFYFRMRLIHGFPGSERRMSVFRHNLRRAGPAAIAA